MEQPIQTFLSAAGVARRVGLPLVTMSRKLRELQIVPDGIIADSQQVFLFRTERLPELRALLSPKPKTKLKP